ncbi:MAG: hypothetical protein M0P31_02845 [Solirubrobacteraceae bacterium]|nr:hypothetical protein [Solirubrobacteraceae bacterium]
MAPATVAGAEVRQQSSQRGGRRITWDRDSIINAIQEWVATYDDPPRAADWNPSSAKWSGQTWRVERYRKGRADGTRWPSLNAAKRPFDGSLNAAIRAAGFEPARPGPRRRDAVDPAQADRIQMPPDVRAMLDATLAAARDAEQRVATLTGRLDRALARNATLVDERDAARRSASTVAADEHDRVAARLRRAEDELERCRAEADAAREAEERLREQLARTTGIDAVAAELASLRAGAADDDGPVGPAVLGEAVTRLAVARRAGGRAAVRDALWQVARSALAWRART